MATANSIVRAKAGGGVVAGLCPEHLEYLQEPPADRDDAVAVLRWSLAWLLDIHRIEAIARRTRVDAARIMAFMELPARQAGQLLTFAEAARLLRATENRIEDRDLRGELDDYRRLAEPYIEAAGINYAKALRQARKVCGEYRAANRAARRFRGATPR